MIDQPTDNFWGVTPLGLLPPELQGDFYDDLMDDEQDQHFFFGGNSRQLYENPRLEIAILEPDGRIAPAQGYDRRPTLIGGRINVHMERYFVEAMPGNNFDLQLGIGSRHHFANRKEPEMVAHTLAVRGVLRDYVSYLNEPVFRDLAITDNLMLDIVVNFVSDKTTRKLLAFIDSDVTRKGIHMLGTYNPIFGTAATYAKGIVKMLLQSRRNQALTDAHVGLLSSPGDLSAPLVEGTYILIQPKSDGSSIDLSRMYYDFSQNKLILSDEAGSRNHLFLRIERVL